MGKCAMPIPPVGGWRIVMAQTENAPCCAIKRAMKRHKETVMAQLIRVASGHADRCGSFE
jgi:hypothetical protein